MPYPEYILTERLGEERIILNLQNEEYLSLNESATLIWEGATQGLSVEQIAAGLSSKFDVDEQEIKNDVVVFLEKLTKLKLI